VHVAAASAAISALRHLMASTAITVVFSGGAGGQRLLHGRVRAADRPLSPPLHLGAKRIIVLAVGQFTGQATNSNAASQPPRPPSFAQVAGHALSSIFLDNLGADLERLYQVNRLLRSLHEQATTDSPPRTSMSSCCSRLGISAPWRSVLRRPLAARRRYLLRGHGSTRGTGANLLSYLLFDREFARALMKLGYDDAMARRDELVGFLDGVSPGYVPLFPRELH
jgi:NTE family protein